MRTTTGPVGATEPQAAPWPDRSFDGIVLAWVGTAVPDPGARAHVVGRRIGQLTALGIDVAVVSGLPLGTLRERLPAAPPGPGRMLLAAAADGRAGLEAVLASMGAHGVPRGLVLLVGAAFDDAPGDQDGRVDRLPRPAPGDRVTVADLGTAPEPAALVRRLLADQVARRRALAVPGLDEDPDWVLVEQSADPARRRAVDALFTLSDGDLGTRGEVEEDGQPLAGTVLAAGVYTGSGPGEHLLQGPWWPALSADDGWAGCVDRRVLDLRGGVLHRQVDAPEGGRVLESARFVSVARRGVLGMRAWTTRPDVHLVPPSVPPGTACVRGEVGGLPWARTAAPEGGGIAVVTSDRTTRAAGRTAMERLATYAADGRQAPRVPRTAALLTTVADDGFDHLFREHRATWARRWRDVDVLVDGDPDRSRAARFALFQLWGVADHGRDAAVGARGLTGPGYLGHVFWDADVFVLPALVSLDPAAALAMLRYRLGRLGRAEAAARAKGLDGTRFPWESARDGDEVTPRSGLIGGVETPIRTGDLEEHIVSDVAWAAHRYATWTGDLGWLRGPGLPLVLGAARYWARRCRVDDAGVAHVDGVIGPDEYHEDVDDNAYTNVMARWVLRRAADLLDDVARGGTDAGTDEPARWRALADSLEDGFDHARGGYRQFRGFDDLEPLLAADLGRLPVAADLLLGRERVQASQIVKQPDVLMLHHLVPEELAPGSLAADLDFYLPRTSHGSSLSPAITAALLARAGRPDDALDVLDLALRMDLDDLSGTTSAGLHLATVGGVWQALLLGFAGVAVDGGVLHVSPRLPQRWPRLTLRFRCLERRVELCVEHDRLAVTTDGLLPVRLGVPGDEPAAPAVTVHGRWAGRLPDGTPLAAAAGRSGRQR